MTNRYLTKSRFKLAVECPTKLFYTGKKDKYYDANQHNDFLAALADGGYQVGALAQLYFPGGHEIEARLNQEALDETNQYLQQKSVVLYEPAIRFENCFIRADVLIKQGNEFELVEVKAKSYDSAKPSMRGARGGIDSDWLPYLQDLAFQTWVVRSAFDKATVRAFLMMPDKSTVAKFDGINQMFKIDGKSHVTTMIPPDLDGEQIAKSLLAKVDVTELIDSILSSEVEYPGGEGSLPDLAARWADKYANDIRIEPTIGGQCKTCQFKLDPAGVQQSGWLQCWTGVTGLSQETLLKDCVLDLYDYKKKQKLIDQGVYQISKVQREDLKKGFSDEIGPDKLDSAQRQWMQVHGLPEDSVEQGFYLNTGWIRKESKTWDPPYHLIDFETAAVALPFFKGMRPYEKVAFQFSHHIFAQDGPVKHIKHANEFLCATPGVFPNFTFVRKLKEALGDRGTVFMWSHHERTTLNEIRRQLEASQEQDREELITFVSNLINGDRAMYDLCKLSAEAYFHPATKGSSSLKQVLPALLSADPELRGRYSQPIYGAPNGIPSKNFSSPEGMAWLDVNDTAAPDPYRKLKIIAKGLLPEGIDEDEGSVIAEGGAAAMAYARLQFESLDAESRARIQSSLLRYCELDTLAMVMALEAYLSLK
jgi:hypothetical protein